MRPIGRQIREGVRRLFVLGLRAEHEAGAAMRSEVDAHIEARVEYLVARGVTEEVARENARNRFGENFNSAMEELVISARGRERALNRREQLALLVQDARLVLRGLGRAPAFTFGVIATFALALGINSAVFRVADRVLARAPVGVVDPSHLRRLHTLMAPSQTSATEGNAFSFPEARIIAQSGAFSALGLYTPARNLRDADGHELAGFYVDSGFFHTLGVQPAAGRFFADREATVGAGQAVAVATYTFWKTRLNAASLTEGVFLTVNDRKYQVVGVTPRGFNGVDLDPVDVWLPLGMAVLGRASINGREIPWYETSMFRGMRGVVRVEARTGGATQALRAAEALNAEQSSTGGIIKSLLLRSIVYSGDATGADGQARMLARLAGVSLLVLLIGCANAANLLLARALRRRQELSIRLALGASRSRIARLIVIESVVLGLGGGFAAAIAGYWTGTTLRQLVFPDAKWNTILFDGRALAFTLSAAVIAGAIAGVAPALQLSKADLSGALKNNQRPTGRRTHATRALLVVFQTALSLGLIVVSGLLVRSMQRLYAVEVGFNSEGLVTTELSSGLFKLSSPVPVAEAAAQLHERLQRDPRALGVSLASNAPFGSFASTTVSVPGEPEADVSSRDGPWYSAVANDFFAVMGTRVVSGRAFTADDGAGSSPVAIVNQTMARLFWHDGNPFRSCLLMLGTCARVVGVVQDIRDSPTIAGAAPRFYLPLAQREMGATTVLVRTAPERASELAATIKGLLPATQRATIQIVNDRVEGFLRPWRVATLLFGALGAVALMLACVGVYSVISYLASERKHEIGVRLALGASAYDIVRLVLHSGVRLIVAGAFFGLLAAAFTTRYLASLLFGVSALDPVVYVGAVASLLFVGTLAAFIPAMRALRTDPTTVLRAD